MRLSLLRLSTAIALTPALLAAQEAEGSGTRTFMKPDTGLMIWTLIIFVLLMFVLSRYAFGPITAAVRAREQALEEALANAKRDREEAARLLEDHAAKIEEASGEAQKIIADGRATAEKMRQGLLEQARNEQHEILDRARREIESEKEKAIVMLRREAVDLALAGASKVIEQELDSAKNRQLVERYLSSLGTIRPSRQ